MKLWFPPQENASDNKDDMFSDLIDQTDEDLVKPPLNSG